MGGDETGGCGSKSPTGVEGETIDGVDRYALAGRNQIRQKRAAGRPVEFTGQASDGGENYDRAKAPGLRKEQHGDSNCSHRKHDGFPAANGIRKLAAKD